MVAIQIELLCCAILTGLIFTVQLVHYPSFGFVSKDRFEEFSRFHQKRISVIVAPVMIVELLASAMKPGSLLNLSGVLLIVIWGVTFLVSMPLHKKLYHGFDAKAVKKLISTNWIRSGAWSIRLALLSREVLF